MSPQDDRVTVAVQKMHTHAEEFAAATAAMYKGSPDVCLPPGTCALSTAKLDVAMLATEIQMRAGEIEELAAVIRAGRALHRAQHSVRVGGLACEHDGRPWPCPTYTALGGTP